MGLDFLERLPEFLKHNLADSAKVLIGAFLVGFIALKWVKSIRKASKAQIEAEKQKLAAQLAERNAEYHREAAESPEGIGAALIFILSTSVLAWIYIRQKRKCIRQNCVAERHGAGNLRHPA